MDKNKSPIPSIEKFMSFKAGDKILAESGEWTVVSEATRSGDVPRMLVNRPNDKTPEFIHFNEKHSIVVDAVGNTIEELSGVLHHPV